MKFPIELPEAAAAKLREEADRLGVRPEELATAAVIDLLNREANDFQAAADYALQKNRELYPAPCLMRYLRLAEVAHARAA